MQKRKIVSAMMGAAIAVANLSSVATPVYAKSNFIFPTVSIATKADVKIETVEEVVLPEIENSAEIQIEEKTERIAEVSKEKADLSEKTLKLIDEKMDVIEKHPKVEKREITVEENLTLDASNEVIEDKTVDSEEIVADNVEALSEEIADISEVTETSETIEEERAVEVEETQAELELIHNICQIQHISIEDCPIYDCPSIESGSVVKTLPIKTNVFVIGDSINDFYSISYDDEVFYVQKENVVKIISEEFEDVEPRIAYLNQKSNILSFPENQANTFLLENVPVNTKLDIVGEHELGYLKVSLGENTGYIAEEYCSDTKRIPKTTEIQLEIAKKAADPDTAPCDLGYCAAWVARVYYSAGLYRDDVMGNAIDFWTKWGTNDGVTSSTRYDNIPVGAVVVGSGSGGDLGNTYGHVGIYLGDGMVADNIGKHHVVTLEDWMARNIGVCDGYNGYIGWVFPFNIDLQEY